MTQFQARWLQLYLSSFGATLFGENFRDPKNGYAKFIDVDAWIDYHIINELTKNPDSHNYSAYFCKARDGKLVAGPV